MLCKLGMVLGALCFQEHWQKSQSVLSLISCECAISLSIQRQRVVWHGKNWRGEGAFPYLAR